jgi:hypothetical protein
MGLAGMPGAGRALGMAGSADRWVRTTVNR